MKYSKEEDIKSHRTTIEWFKLLLEDSLPEETPDMRLYLKEGFREEIKLHEDNIRLLMETI